MNLAWWPAEHGGLVALQTRYIPVNTPRTRRNVENECLVVPPTAPHVVRTSPVGNFLVDHISARGGISAGRACPAHHIPVFDEETIAWVGCSRLLHSTWAGYVCRHQGTQRVILDCPRLENLANCHIGDDMPCPPHSDDFGCVGGLMPGETCVSECPPHHRFVDNHLRIQNTCPLAAPVCEPVCQSEHIPTAPPWVPFRIEWDSFGQKGIVKHVSNGHVCSPAVLECGDTYKRISCTAKRCPPLEWAGIHESVEQNAQIVPKCPSKQASSTPVLICKNDGTWSLPQPSCHPVRPSSIQTLRGQCVNNRLAITKIVTDPGFPPIAMENKVQFSERCTSPPPRCCPHKGLASSDGSYDNRNQPLCTCKFASHGMTRHGTCCTMTQVPKPPKMVFRSEFKGTFRLVPCSPEPCLANSCYTHPLGCLAFNKTHMARADSGYETEILRTAFTWNIR